MTESSKPVVFYRGKPDIFVSIDKDGNEIRFASLYALNHPKLGRTTVRTSLIKYITDDGIIETLNTIYQPVNEEML